MEDKPDFLVLLRREIANGETQYAEITTFDEARKAIRESLARLEMVRQQDVSTQSGAFVAYCNLVDIAAAVQVVMETEPCLSRMVKDRLRDIDKARNAKNTRAEKEPSNRGPMEILAEKLHKASAEQTRDGLAEVALMGLLSGRASTPPSASLSPEAMAEYAYRVADAMMAARVRGGE